MSKRHFKQASLTHNIGSVEDMQKLKTAPLPEIVLLGRSNVGKSSLINHLLDIKGFAKVSSTPGKTKRIHFFEIDQKFYLVDLPGYGYASVSKQRKELWEELIETYFLSKRNPQLGLLLLDIRREKLSELDLQMVRWMHQICIPIVFVFTKADKLSANEIKNNTKQIEQQLFKILQTEEIRSVCYSIKHAAGRETLIRQIKQYI